MLNQNEKSENVKSLEVEAKTVDEAIEQGLAQLGVSRADVNIQILREGKRGVFGLGSEDALVRLTRQDPEPDEASTTEDAVSEVETATEDIEPSLPKEEEINDEVESPSASTESEVPDSVEAIATEALAGLLTRMGIKAEITARRATDLVDEGEEPSLVLDITGPDLGILIGRRSETLRAIQYMVRLMVSKQLSQWHDILIDVESYRVRRRHSLQQLAEKMAERAVKTGRKVVMEAMPSYERRIIHLALRNNPTVFTKSVGSDDNRKVTIIPK